MHLERREILLLVVLVVLQLGLRGPTLLLNRALIMRQSRAAYIRAWLRCGNKVKGPTSMAATAVDSWSSFFTIIAIIDCICFSWDTCWVYVR